MPLARRPPNRIRVVAHVDLDCFYVQVEQRRTPELRGKPTAVIQYNPWKGGACIAVGYEARKCGVKRSMRGNDAKAVCPDINLVQVPVTHEKADLSIYRDAGSEVVTVLSRVGKCERASIDEAYLDITEAAEKLASSNELPRLVSEEASKSHIIGLPEFDVIEWLSKQHESREDLLLAYGAIIIADIRMAVLSETGFTCSAGIAHNKMLAKLASGMHKPSQQTLVPSSSVEGLLATLPIKKIGKLGGKLGNSLEVELGIKTGGDLLQYSESKLQDMYGVNTGTWLFNIARGINGDEVQERTLPKSHSSGKTFPGPRALKTFDNVGYWLKELAETLQDRLEEDLTQNYRIAHLLTIHGACYIEGRPEGSKFPSKSCTLRYGAEKIAEDSRCLFERCLREFQMAGKKDNELSTDWVVTGLSLTASNIIPKPTGVNPITQYFTANHSQVSKCHSKDTEVGTSEENKSTNSAWFPRDEHVEESPSEQVKMSTMVSRGEVEESPTKQTKKSTTLAELWERKASKRDAFVEYRQEEIDGDVLSELPEEIQLELRHRLGIKRAKPSTIADFFKSKT